MFQPVPFKKLPSSKGPPAPSLSSPDLFLFQEADTCNLEETYPNTQPWLTGLWRLPESGSQVVCGTRNSPALGHSAHGRAFRSRYKGSKNQAHGALSNNFLSSREEGGLPQCQRARWGRGSRRKPRAVRSAQGRHLGWNPVSITS